LGIKTEVVHNASIMTAVGVCGVNLYNFGQTVSIPFFTPTWQPDSFYDKIAFNLSGKLHTLCLLGVCVLPVLTLLPNRISKCLLLHQTSR
jgi:diphthine methyl ester synthase